MKSIPIKNYSSNHNTITKPESELFSSNPSTNTKPETKKTFYETLDYFCSNIEKHNNKISLKRPVPQSLTNSFKDSSNVKRQKLNQEQIVQNKAYTKQDVDYLLLYINGIGNNTLLKINGLKLPENQREFNIFKLFGKNPFFKQTAIQSKLCTNDEYIMIQTAFQRKAIIINYTLNFKKKDGKQTSKIINHFDIINLKSKINNNRNISSDFEGEKYIKNKLLKNLPILAEYASKIKDTPENQRTILDHNNLVHFEFIDFLMSYHNLQINK